MTLGRLQAPQNKSPAKAGLVLLDGYQRLFEAIVDPSFGQIVWCHLDLYLVASQNADAVFAHLACRMCDDLMAVFQLDPKRRIGQEFLHDTGKFERIFLGHVISIMMVSRESAGRALK